MCGNRIQGYRNSKRMAVNGMVERLCKEEDVGYVDMWDSFVGNEELYFRDGLHLSGKGAAVLAEGLSGAVASGLGKVRYVVGQGGCRKRLYVDKRIGDPRRYRGTHQNLELNVYA